MPDHDRQHLLQRASSSELRLTSPLNKSDSFIMPQPILLT